MRLSVIIITRNESANIESCLLSVRFADEVIVVDSGSSDDTVALAESLGARVESTTEWPGFGPQKNRALALAQGEWVLSLDADERITPELEQEILTVLRTPEFDSYDIPRLSSFCGRFIRHSGWWPDRVTRLFRRGSARFTDATVHERVEAQGKTGHLRAHMLHYTYPDLSSALQKMDRYSSDAARAMYARGKRAGLGSALGHGFWTFVRIYLIRRGFLDGRHGVILAVVAAMGSFARYSKLMFMSLGNESDAVERKRDPS